MTMRQPSGTTWDVLTRSPTAWTGKATVPGPDAENARFETPKSGTTKSNISLAHLTALLGGRRSMPVGICHPATRQKAALETAASTTASPVAKRSATPSAAAEDTPRREDHGSREPQCVPGTRPPAFVFPHSSDSIDVEFHERFRHVVDFFRKNIEEDPYLRDHVQRIDYSLRMCGTSREDIHPSILVFCHPRDFPHLRRLLKSNGLRQQYCRKYHERSRKRNFSSLHGPEAHGSGSTQRPLFDLYFWRDKRPLQLLCGTLSNVRLSPKPRIHPSTKPAFDISELTMCGSHVTSVEDATRFSTLGFVVQIGSGFYGLTCSHAFRGGRQSDLSSHGANQTTGSVVSPGIRQSKPEPTREELEAEMVADVDTDGYLTDIDYDSLSDQDSFVGDNDGNGLESPTSSAGHIFASLPLISDADQADDLDLDWALVKLNAPELRRPNAFIDPERSEEPIFLPNRISEAPRKDTPVLILRRGGVPIKGTLHPAPSVLGGVNGKAPSHVWTVSPDGHNDLLKGDSGSVVVDAATHDIYGHVVGLNPLGEVYVSPFSSVLEQLQKHFKNAKVSLPDPISTLTDLVGFHYRQGHHQLASRLMERLVAARMKRLGVASNEEARSTRSTFMDLFNTTLFQKDDGRKSSPSSAKENIAPSSVEQLHRLNLEITRLKEEYHALQKQSNEAIELLVTELIEAATRNGNSNLKRKAPEEVRMLYERHEQKPETWESKYGRQSKKPKLEMTPTHDGGLHGLQHPQKPSSAPAMKPRFDMTTLLNSYNERRRRSSSRVEEDMDSHWMDDTTTKMPGPPLPRDAQSGADAVVKNSQLLLSSLFKSAHVLAKEYFNCDVDEEVLDFRSDWTWAVLREELAPNGHLPLIKTNSKSAKELRTVAFLSILGTSLASFIFVPDFPRSWHVQPGSAEATKHGQSQHTHCPETGVPKMVLYRAKQVVTEVSSTTDFLLNEKRLPDFERDLQSLVLEACKVWEVIQQLDAEIQPHSDWAFTYIDGIDAPLWREMPLQHRDELPSCRNSGGRDNMGMVWPAFISWKEDKKQLVMEGLVLKPVQRARQENQSQSALAVARSLRMFRIDQEAVA